MLTKFHKENPLKGGMSKEEIKTKIFSKNLKQKNYDEILDLYEDRRSIKQINNLLSLYDFEIVYSEPQKIMKDLILKSFKEGAFAPPKFEDLSAKEKDKKAFKMVFDSLIDSGDLVRIGDDLIFLKEHYENAKNLVREHIIKNGGITPADGREILNSSRKYVVGLLEHFDTIKLTKRLEDKRVLY